MGFMLNCISTKYLCQHCLTEPDIIIIVSVAQQDRASAS